MELENFAPPTRPCCRPGCLSNLEGAWMPSLILFPTAPAKLREATAINLLGILLCKHCIDGSKPQDFLSNKAWELLEAKFKGHTKPEFDRKKVRLEFRFIAVGMEVKAPVKPAEPLPENMIPAGTRQWTDDDGLKVGENDLNGTKEVIPQEQMDS